jgi:hypothetical protein
MRRRTEPSTDNSCAPAGQTCKPEVRAHSFVKYGPRERPFNWDGRRRGCSFRYENPLSSGLLCAFRSTQRMLGQGALAGPSGIRNSSSGIFSPPTSVKRPKQPLNHRVRAYLRWTSPSNEALVTWTRKHADDVISLIPPPALERAWLSTGTGRSGPELSGD